MPLRTIKTGIVLLFATLVAGCASQNAMKTLPDDVRISILADQARTNMDAEEASTVAGSVEAPSGEIRLSQEELLFRARQRQMAGMDGLEPEVAEVAEVAEPGIPGAEEQPDSRQLFAQALEMQRARTSQTGERRTGSAPAEMAHAGSGDQGSPDSMVDIWNQALALRAELAAESVPPAQGQISLEAPAGEAGDDPTIQPA